MNITLAGTKVKLDNRTLAFEGNNGVDDIIVTVDTDPSWTYKLDIDYANENCCCGDEHYNIIQLNRDGDVCSVTLTMDMLPHSGRYTMQLRGINEDGRVYHSELFEVCLSILPGRRFRRSHERSRVLLVTRKASALSWNPNTLFVAVR